MDILFLWFEMLIKLVLGMLLVLVGILFIISFFKSIYQSIYQKQPFFKIFYDDFRKRLAKMIDVIF